MSRNVFLGADLGPVINATGIAPAIDGAGTVWNELQSTKFTERAVPLAREIKASKADLVGLQEVALWRKQTPSDGGAAPISPIPGATPATTVEFDFLDLLKKQLGNSYKVVVVQEEFEAELPVDADGNDATGTGPLASLGADFDARLTMRDVILIKRGSKVKVGKTRKGHFTTRYEPDIGGIKLPVDRGWASVEARVGKRKFRFIDTHLEAFGDPKIREAQAKELTKGPLKTQDADRAGRRPQLRHRAPQRAGEAGRRPRVPRAGRSSASRTTARVQSCCFDSLFDANATFDHTVDHVLTKPGLTTTRASVTGNDAGERTASGLWPSDHGGVISRMRLRR